MTHFLWSEDARPQTISQCVLPADIKKTLQGYVDSKVIPTLLFAGPPGVGKTTAAKAMCNEVGCDFMFINGSDERGIDVLRTKIKSYASTMSFGGGSKVIIVDEADNLTPDCQDALRASIEEYSANCSFIFTLNNVSKFREALQSRCSTIEFKIKSEDKPKMAATFFKRVLGILETRGVKADTKVVAEVVQRYFPDFRKTLNELQKYAVNGSIDVGILAHVSDVSVKELIGFLKSKNFPAVRKWVATNLDDASRIYRRIYDELSTVLQPSSVPDAIVIIAKYQYQNSFAADPEVQLTACLVEILIQCSFA